MLCPTLFVVDSMESSNKGENVCNRNLLLGCSVGHAISNTFRGAGSTDKAR